MLDIQPSEITPRFALEPGDHVSIVDKDFSVVERRGAGVVLTPADGRGNTCEYTDTQLAHFSRVGQLRHQPGPAAFTPAEDLDVDRAAFIASRTPKQREDAELKEAIVLAFQDRCAKGLVKRTYASVDENMDAILLAAGRLDRDGRTRRISTKDELSAKSLLRYVQKYEQFGLAGLFRGFDGNRAPRLQPQVHGIMNEVVQGYLDPREPTKEMIFEKVRDAIKEANAERREKDLVALIQPSRETVRKAINALNPFLVCLHRKGAEAAKRQFAPVGRGLSVERPLQRVEIDEWHADIVVILGKCGLLDHLDPKLRARIEKADGKTRVRVSVAIDCATRCILGMRITPVVDTESALQTIEMILDDKGVYADAVGALNPWHMAGTPALIVTDCGRNFVSKATRHAVAALGSRLEHCPAGEPEMKATIERLFGTIATRLLPRLNGRTLHNVVAKGDRDPHNDAALTLEDLCAVLVRWVVDVYHGTPHRGLLGDTPLDAWNRLTARYGVRPAPRKQARFLTFGQEETRTLQKTGLTRMNIRYHSDALAALMRRESDRTVKLRWHPADLGSIMALVDGEWREVKSVESMFDGVSAATWEAACQSIRARTKANAMIHADTISEALKEIEAINARAVRRQGIAVDYWTPERVAKIEDSLSIGFDLSRDAREAAGEAAAGGSDGFGTDLATARDLENHHAREDGHDADTETAGAPCPDEVADGPQTGNTQSERIRPAQQGARRRLRRDDDGTDVSFD